VKISELFDVINFVSAYADYILQMSFCLHFILEFLKQNKQVDSYHIIREILLHVMFLECFTPKITNPVTLQSRTEFFCALCRSDTGRML